MIYLLIFLLNCTNKEQNKSLTRSIDSNFLFRAHVKDFYNEDQKYAYIIVFWYLPFDSKVVISEKINGKDIELLTMDSKKEYNQYIYKLKKDGLIRTIGVRWQDIDSHVSFSLDDKKNFNIFEER